MKRVWMISWAVCAACLLSPTTWATDFTLGFQGGDSATGSAGDPWSGPYFCTLSSAGGGSGAQGWSISISVDSASISAVTTDGTDAAALFNTQFDQTELTSGAGNEGAVSAIVLSLTKNIVLPPDSTSTIASITVGGTIPGGGGTATLRYIDGRTGSGQPVDNNITQDGNTVKPTLGSKEITLIEVVSCCNAPLNVGFTGANLSTPNAYDGIADDGAGLCSGGGGQVVTEVDDGATGSTHVFATISSKAVPDGGVQGWSFSIALNGDAELTNPDPTLDPTTVGTSVDKYQDTPFNQTEAIDPGKNGGQRGAVSAVVLSLTKNRVLPVTSTESILDFGLTANAAQGAADIVGSLKFQNGLIGSGQPVNNAMTVGGNTSDICNVATASVQVVFRLKPAPSTSQFIRGNPNPDGKLDIADPIWIINQLFRGGPASPCVASEDANDDGQVDATDATFLIAYLFQAGSPPPPPFPGCGDDPTPGSDPASECPAGSIPACP